MTSLRAVFDTNVFSASHFDELAASSVQRHCISGRISPVYTSVFLEEMLQSYSAERCRQDLLTRWLPFILSTAQQFCRELPLIWRDELVSGKGPLASPFMSTRSARNVRTALQGLPSDGSWAFVDETRLVRDASLKRKQAQRDLSKRMRARISKEARSHQVGRPVNWFRLKEGEALRNGLVEMVGRGVIDRFLNASNPVALANEWWRNKQRYPFITQFAENIAYKESHFATEENSPIDLNAQADLDLMTHLLHADMLVTNETGFMKTAFQDLWKARGKTLMNSSEFVSLANRF